MLLGKNIIRRQKEMQNKKYNVLTFMTFYVHKTQIKTIY